MSFTHLEAVIYRLKCLDAKTYYIGSAINLDERMRRHKSIANNTGSKSIIQGGNYEIKILEKIPCNVYTDLFPTEQKYLDRYREKYEEFVLNERNAFLTEEQKRLSKKNWAAINYINNKDNILSDEEKEKKRAINNIASAKWRANNKERRNEKINCVCGGKYTRANKSIHFGSKMHQNYISKINENKI